MHTGKGIAPILSVGRALAEIGIDPANSENGSAIQNEILRAFDRTRICGRAEMIWNNKRRSQRLALSVPVVAYRSEKIGLPFSEGTRTLMLSAHGALITLAAKVVVDQKLFLKHALSGEEQECRVVFTQKKPSGPTEVGIEFRQPAPHFWHIAFPPSDWTPPAPQLAADMRF